MTIRKRIWLALSAVSVGFLIFVGVDLSRLQAGINIASDAVLLRSQENLEGRSRLITDHDNFPVVVENEVIVRVYAREVANATGNIFFIHGAGGGAWVWEGYFASFSDTFNLYALSWRGHFDSSPVDDAYSSDYVADQLAVLDAITGRNDLPVHVVGHSYGGATSVLMAAQTEAEIASMHLLAPVVPLDYSLMQRLLVPMIAPSFIKTENDAEGVFGGMFLSEGRMRHYFDTYASQPYSEEKPGLIAGDGIDPNWQEELQMAYDALHEQQIPTWLMIADYDNVVVPRRQHLAATAANATILSFESGHYLQLDTKADQVLQSIVSNLDELTGLQE